MTSPATAGRIARLVLGGACVVDLSPDMTAHIRSVSLSDARAGHCATRHELRSAIVWADVVVVHHPVLGRAELDALDALDAMAVAERDNDVVVP